MAGGLSFFVLGSIRAERDGSVLELGGRRPRSVVARLLIAGGRVVPAESVVADIWNTDMQPRAMALLQAQVSQLRRVLEPARAPRAPATVLVTEPPGYVLRGDGMLDAERAVQLAGEGDGLLDSEPRRAADRYAMALALWRGPAYAEFADEPWARSEVTRLENLHLGLVERRATATTASGDHQTAISLLQPHVEAHPLREEGWRLLALALYRAGQQADALAALQQARSHLVEGLGLEPGPELRQIEADILVHAPHLLRTHMTPIDRPSSTPPIVAQHPTAILVGRDVEMAALTELASHAAADELRVAQVSAEAGGGKTALVDELTQRLAGSGWSTCRVRCPETDAPRGWPWLEALRHLASASPPPDDDVLAAWLRDEPLSLAGEDAVWRRHRLHRAIAGWLSAVAVGAPLLVVVDDLHRAEDETANLLIDLVSSLRSSPVLVVVAYRPDPSPVLIGALGAMAHQSPLRLELAGLAAPAIDALIDRLAAGPVDPAARAMVIARTGGNPFFTGEVVRLIAAGADARGVPSTVRDAVRLRLAALPALTGTMLKVAAVGGHEISTEVLLAALPPSGADEESLLDALELGLLSGLITETSAGRLRFGHAIVRDTLAEDASSARASRWHGRIADAMEALEPADVMGLAHHHASAGPSHAASTARAAAAAADLAERRFAYADAAAWWAQAAHARAVAEPKEVTPRLELVARQIRALQLHGDIAGSRQIRAEILPTAAATGDNEMIATVILAADAPIIWSTRAFVTHDDHLVDVSERTIACLPERPDLQSRLLAIIAVELEGDASQRGYDASLEALTLARRSADPEVLAHALYARYLHTYRDGPEGTEERGTLGREMLTTSRRAGLGHFEAAAHLVLVQHACATTDLTAADRHAAEAARLAEAYGLPLLLGLVHWYGAMRIAIEGRWQDAEAAYVAASAEIDATGYYGQGSLVLAMFCLQLSAGRTDQLTGLTDALLGSGPDARTGEAQELIALGLFLTGRHDEARSFLGPPHWIRPDYAAPVVYAARGMVAMHLGDDERVSSAYEALLPYERSLCGAQSASVTLGPTATLLASLADYRGDVEAASAHRQQALELAEAVGNADWIRLALGTAASPAASPSDG